MTAHYSDSQPANTHAARRRSPCVNTAAVPFHADYLRHLRVGIKSSHAPPGGNLDFEGLENAESFTAKDLGRDVIDICIGNR